jgi:hypothetical protein
MKFKTTLTLSFFLFSAWLGAIAMPVQFYTLNAEVENGGVHVTWSTISETSNLHFVIQRSPNGDTWTDLGVVNGSTNSSTLVEYNYFDPELSPFRVYYRIKQIDFNGISNYSGKIKIGKPQQYFDHVKSYPNPATNELNVPMKDAPEGTELIVLNSLGTELFRQTMTSKGIEKIDLSSLSKGFYYLKLSNGESESTQRFFKQ